MMNFSGVWALIAQTFRDSIRAKWLIMFTAVFLLLAINVPLLALASFRYLPPNYLTVFLPTLVTVSFPFLPLLALPMGSTIIVDERESGTMQYVLSNPISKNEYLLGRTIGIISATTGVIVLGYGIAALTVYNINLVAYREVLSILTVGVMLNIAMIALSLVVSTLTRKRAAALGIAIFVWFALSVFSDTGFLSSIAAITMGASPTIAVILGNPMEAALTLALIWLGGGQLGSGTPGLVLYYYLGQSHVVNDLIIAVVSWIIVCFALVFFIFNRQDST
jgi:ABC-type transport system involved in multi-copper enzyme maturation permease subunit